MKSGLLPKIHREVRCGAIVALYVQDPATGRLGLWLVPAARRRALAPRREFLRALQVAAIMELYTGRELTAMGPVQPLYQRHRL